MANNVKQPEVANSSHVCYEWSLRPEKIRRIRCEFDFISLETKWPRHLG